MSESAKQNMARKIIIDCDMGTDDAVALCMLLFDPRVEVLAITATEGVVTAQQSNNNLQAILNELDPDRYPRLGMASPCEHAPPINTSYLYGDDGLGNSALEVSPLQHSLLSEKLIIDCVRANPDEVSIICLGPLTNLAKAFRRDPLLPGMVDRIVMTGGSFDGVGNVQPMAEFNFFFDPPSAREVFHSRTTKTLVPLDITRQVTFGLEILEQLPDEESRVGYFLRQILSYSFRSYRQQLGQENITLNDAIGALGVIEPGLFAFEEYFGDVECDGELTRGVTVFDRRSVTDSRPNMEVARKIDTQRARTIVMDQIEKSGRLT